MSFENSVLDFKKPHRRQESAPEVAEKEGEDLASLQNDAFFEQRVIEELDAEANMRKAQADEEWEEKLNKLHEENKDDGYHDLGPERGRGAK